MAAKNRKNRILCYTVAVLVTAVQILPILVVLMNSLRSNSDISKMMIGFPTQPIITNYITAWVKGGYLHAYQSSLIIGFGTSISVTLLVGLAAYGMVKMNCYGRYFFHTYFVAGLAIPSFAIIVPLFFIFYRLGLVNTHLGMILIYIGINLSFNFIFMYSFFEGMPPELDDAARIDGASELQNFRHIVMPLARPIMTSVMLIVFVNTWNEFLFSNTFLQKEEVRTVSLRFYNFVGRNGSDYGYIYAAAIITILPIFILYFLMQDSFVEGMTSGSVKG